MLVLAIQFSRTKNAANLAITASGLRPLAALRTSRTARCLVRVVAVISLVPKEEAHEQSYTGRRRIAKIRSSPSQNRRQKPV